MDIEENNLINICFPIGELDVLEQSLFEYDRVLLERLLKDKTTDENIKWGTLDYIENGPMFGIDKEITPELVTGVYSRIIQPRASKPKIEQTKRTREKAEVFTPSWVCNKQNNLIDEAWFGHKDVFNVENDIEWVPNRNRIMFPNVKGKTWQDYVEDTRLEVACGEAPYLVSRYDTTTGEILPVDKRIGILDRKLRVVSENACNETDWYKWSEIAFQHTYGYDYQGDNVLLARENLLYTFSDYYVIKFNKEPEKKKLRKIANIISWNIWQMDGLNMVCPFTKIDKPEQLTLNLYMDDLDVDVNEEVESGVKDLVPCRIYDWKANKSIEYKSLIKR